MIIEKSLLQEFFDNEVLTRLDDVLVELCSCFDSSAKLNDELSSCYSNLTDTEMDKLGVQQSEFLGNILFPSTDEEFLQTTALRVGKVHAFIGIRTAWLLQIFAEMEDRLSLILADGGMLSASAQQYIFFVKARLAQFLSALLQAEAQFDETLERLVADVSIAISGASTATDAIKAMLSSLFALEGVSSIAFARPDAHGIFQYEFFEGERFTRYLDGRSGAGFSPVSTDKSVFQGNGPTGRMWRTGQVQFCNSVANDSSMIPWAQGLTELGTRSSVALPVTLADGELLAGVVIYSQWPGYFGVSRRLRAFEYITHVLSSTLSQLDSGIVLNYVRRNELRERLRSGFLEIHFQPIVSLKDFSLVKVEALARLRDDESQLMSPGDFLAAFGSEEFLFLFERGLEIGLATLDEWDKVGLSCGLSLNLPAQGLVDRRYLDAVILQLEKNEIEPERLTLELTEEKDLGKLGVDVSIARAFRDLGVLLAQDDLGAGYSSLVRLEMFGFHEVKIDQALIRSASDPTNSLDLIQHLTNLSHDLGMSVVVEGLESESLIEAAAILGADCGQGYGIAKPLPKDELLAWYTSYRRRAFPHAPKTTFGAMALMRKWSRKLVALGAFIDRIDPEFLITDLRSHLANFSELEFERRLQEYYSESEASTVVSFVRLSEVIFKDLLELSKSTAVKPADDSAYYDIDGEGANHTKELDLPDRVVVTPAQLYKIFELQNKILISLSGGASREDLLSEICRQAEALLPNSVATVMLIDDDGDLYLKAAPSLDATAAAHFNKVIVGPNTGSCANVILHGEPVYVSNTSVDSRWKDLVQVARDLDICACWSFPVFDNSGNLTGTFALSSFEVRTPSAFYRQLLENCASLVSIVLYQLDQDEAKRARGTRLEKMFQDNATNKMIYRVSDGAIVEVNDHAVAFLGYSSEELLSMVISDVNENLTLSVLQTKIANVGENRSWHGYTYHRLANKELRAVEFEGKLFEDNDELFVYSTFFDAPYFSNELESERLITGEILDSVSAMVVVIDEDGLISRFNRRAEVITGYEAQEVIGISDIWHNWMEPLGFEIFNAAMQVALSEGKSEIIDIWHINRTGERRLMEIRFMSFSGATSFSKDRLALLCTDITDRHNDFVAVEGQLDFISRVFEVLTSLVFVIDRDGYVRQCNRAVMDFVGETFEQISSEPLYIAKFIAPEGHVSVKEWFLSAIAGNVVEHTVLTWINKNGERRVLEWSNVGIYDREGLLSQIVIMGTDITERRSKERQLEKAAVVFENSSEAIVIADYTSTITEVNPAYCAITGFSREDVIGKPARFVASDDQNEEFFTELNERLYRTGHWSGTSKNRRADGSVYPSLISITIIRGARESDEQTVIQISDISDLMENQRKLADLAYYDHLTHLPNRTLISKKMVDLMALSRRSRRAMALVYLDVDNFKFVNDSYGHDVGDKLLCVLAERMTSTLREVDSVARIGGDEFVCLLSEIENPADCSDILERLARVLSEPLVVDGSAGSLVVETSASMGVVFAQDGDSDPDSLLRRADMLMYEAKRGGGDRYVCEIFPPKHKRV